MKYKEEIQRICYESVGKAPVLSAYKYTGYRTLFLALILFAFYFIPAIYYHDDLKLTALMYGATILLYIMCSMAVYDEEEEAIRENLRIHICPYIVDVHDKTIYRMILSQFLYNDNCTKIVQLMKKKDTLEQLLNKLDRDDETYKHLEERLKKLEQEIHGLEPKCVESTVKKIVETILREASRDEQ